MDPLTLITSIPGIGPYLPYLTLAITAAALAAPFLPGPTQPTGLYAAFYAAVNWLAINVGHARNANSPTLTGAVAGPGVNSAPVIATAVREAAPGEPPAAAAPKPPTTP